MTSYQSAIVNIVCTIFELFAVEECIVILKSGVGVAHGHWKLRHSIERIRVLMHLPL